MDMFANLKTGTKIMGGFCVAIAVMTAVGMTSYVSAERITARLDDVSEHQFPAALCLDAINEAQTDVARQLELLVNPRADAHARRSAEKELADAFRRLDDAWKKYEALPHGEAALARWRAMAAPWSTWRTAAERTLELVQERDRLAEQGTRDPRELQRLDDQAWEARVRTHAAYDDAWKAIMAAVEQTQADVREGKQAGAAAARTGLLLITLSALLGAAVMLVLGFLLARIIARNIRGLLTEAGKLQQAVVQGKLEVRGDPAAVGLEFQPVVAGMNQTIDAFMRPIRLTADYVDRIAKGDLPPTITDEYQGDFNLTKQNLNTCIEAVHALTRDAVALSKAAVEGKLSTRADAARHQGDYRKIVEGVNATLDAVLSPVNEAAAVLERLAQRDLIARMQGSYQGEHAKIKEALNATAGALHDSIAQVAKSVEQVSAASSQIASSSQAVASGASEQAASLEETSSSLESMASMTKHATDHAQQANGLAQQARTAATEGGAAMEQMTSAMGKIKASAEGTSQIIKDINEIAFQTNLLALNAAVEAARAGEAGRGFAVVAEEVRSLALRSKEAATKTEELIRQSVREAGEGEVTARHVHEKLQEIAGSVTKVSDIVAEIAASAKEQSAGIEQVNKAVAQMNQVTQENAANSEESSSAATELSGQSQELAAMVATFRLAQASSRAGATPAPKRPGGRSTAAARARPAGGHEANGHVNGTNGHVNGVHGATIAASKLIPLEGDTALDDF